MGFRINWYSNKAHPGRNKIGINIFFFKLFNKYKKTYKVVKLYQKLRDQMQALGFLKRIIIN